MAKTIEAQLPLLELPPGKPSVRRKKPLSAELTAKHCNALLAELDRVAAAQAARAHHLVELFAAAERAHEREADQTSSVTRRSSAAT